MWRGICSKVVDGGCEQQVGMVEDRDFVGVALVWFQNGEPVGLTPPKAIFQQVILFRNE